MVLKIASLAAGTTKTSGTAFITSYTFSQSRRLHVSLSSDIAFTLQVTKDGSNYYNGASVDAGGSMDVSIWVMAGDILNFKQTSGSTATLGWFEVFAEDG